MRDSLCFRSVEFDVGDTDPELPSAELKTTELPATELPATELPATNAPAAAEGDFVLRRGKYFEVGDYPDKEFSLSEEEADAAVESFAGAPINLEHTPTLFDGKLGRVRRLWRQGRDLLAEYAIPAWLHRLTGGEPLRISSEWDRATKRPIAAALVLSPRIQDAVMMAAFEAAGEESQSVSVPNRAGKENRIMSLLARFTAFLRGEGLLEDEEKAQGDIEAGGSISEQGASPPITSPGEQHASALCSSLKFSGTPEYRQMSAELNEQAAIIAELKADFVREYDKAQYVDNVRELKELVRLGKMTAGECEQWRDVAAEHPAAFAAVLGTLKARPVLPQFNDRATRRIAPDPEEPAAA